MTPAATEVVKGLVCSAAVVLAWRTSRRRSRPGAAVRRDRLTRAWVFLAVLGVGVHFRFSAERALSHYNAYDLVHYYLNAKYLPELGYTKLYEACIVADLQGANRLRDVSSIRNLGTQKIEPGGVSRIRERPEEITSLFTRERWVSFRRDFRVLDARLGVATWREILIDRGYNATPFWHVVGHALASVVPAERIKILCHIDTALLALAMTIVARSYGARVAAIAVVWLTAGFPSYWPGIGAGFLRLDWLAFSVMACCFARGRGHAAAGALIGLATLQRVFPAVLLFGLLAKGAARLVSERRVDRGAAEAAVGFLATVAAGTALAVALQGAGQHALWMSDLKIQVAAENLSVQRMGLAPALAYRGEVDEEGFDWPRKRRMIGTGWMGPARLGIALVLLSLLAATMRPYGPPHGPHRADDDLTQLGFLPFALLATASFYYWTLCVVTVIHHARHGPSSRQDAAGLAALFAVQVYAHLVNVALDFRYALTATLSILFVLYCAWVIGARAAAARRAFRGAA